MKRIILATVLLLLMATFVYSHDVVVSFVLDETGSMGRRRDATISAFNEYLQTLKTRSEEVRLTLTKFNSEKIDIIYKDIGVNYVSDLTRETYHPNSMTPLYDAIGQTIKAIEDNKEQSVLFVILTDGLENSSMEYGYKDVLKLIEEKKKDNWTFVFLGADMDSYIAEQIGIPKGNFYQWDSSGNIGIGTDSPFYQLNTNTSAYFDSGMVQTKGFFVLPDSTEKKEK